MDKDWYQVQCITAATAAVIDKNLSPVLTNAAGGPGRLFTCPLSADINRYLVFSRLTNLSSHVIVRCSKTLP
ncbi:hypothetical protein ElyMa_002014100, partial [Elysia marginata]